MADATDAIDAMLRSSRSEAAGRRLRQQGASRPMRPILTLRSRPSTVNAIDPNDKIVANDASDATDTVSQVVAESLISGGKSSDRCPGNVLLESKDRATFVSPSASGSLVTTQRDAELGKRVVVDFNLETLNLTPKS